MDNNMIKLEYFYGNEPDNLCFYRIPKVLFTKAYFSGLSTDAKVLYGLLLDQMSMSRENRWLDKENRVYIIYSIQRACAYLGCKKDKALKLFAELDTDTGIGLIERVKRGQGKADLIYVKSFEIPQEAEERAEIKKLRENRSKHNNSISDPSYRNADNSSDKPVGKTYQSEIPTTFSREKVVEKTDRSEKPTSGSLKFRSLEVGKTDPNYTDENNTKRNHLPSVFSDQNVESTEDNRRDEWIGYDKNNRQEDHSGRAECTMQYGYDRQDGWYGSDRHDIRDRQDAQSEREAYIQFLRKQVGYESLLQEEAYRFEKEKIDGIISVIADLAVTTPPDGIEWVNSRPYPHEVVKNRLLKTDRLILEYVLANMNENTTKIRKIRPYLITALYNARDEMSISVSSRINHDWYGNGTETKGRTYA